MRIALIKFDGDTYSLVTQESFDFKVGQTYTLTTGEGRYLTKIVSLQPLTGIEVATIESDFLGGWLPVIAAWALMIGATLWIYGGGCTRC